MVMAILAMLTALIVPAVRGALARGRIVTCLGNQRQLGAAMLLVSGDGYRGLPAGALVPYNGTLFIDNQEWPFTWFGALAGELGLSGRLRPPAAADDLSDTRPDLFWCPEADPLVSGWRADTLCYSGNRRGVMSTLRWIRRGKVDERSLTHLVTIPNPSRRVMFCDSDGTGQWDDQVLVIQFPPPPTQELRPGNRHRGGGIVTFIDGHARWLAYGELVGRKGPFDEN